MSAFKKLSVEGDSLEVWAEGIGRPMYLSHALDGGLLVAVFLAHEPIIFVDFFLSFPESAIGLLDALFDQPPLFVIREPMDGGDVAIGVLDALATRL